MTSAMTRTIQPTQSSELPEVVRMGLEYKRRGIQAPPQIQAMTSEYERRGLTGVATPQYDPVQQIEYDQTQADVAAADRLESLQSKPYEQDFQQEQRGKFVDDQMGEWLNKIEQTAMATPAFESQQNLDPLGQLGVHLGAIDERMNYQQRQDLYSSIGEKNFQKKRDEFGAQFDSENSPEARYLRDRDNYGDLLAQQYRDAHPEARDSEVFNHMHRELARYGYNPQNAGEFGTVIDKRDLAEDLQRVQDVTAPLVDRAPGFLPPVVALGTGAVKSFQDSMATFVGTLGAGGVAQFLESTIGDDMGFRDQQEAIQDYWANTAGQNFVLGTTTQQGFKGAALKFAETMGGVASDLSQTIVASSVGAGGAKLAGLNARLAQISGQLSGMGFMGAKEGGGAYRTVYDGLIRKGYTPEEANKRALYAGVSVGFVNALLEKAPIDAFVFANPRTINRLQAGLRGAVVEGSQEAAQEAVNVLAEFEAGASTSPVVSWDNAKRLFTAALAGSLVGGGLGLASGGTGARADITQDVEADIIARIDRAQRDQKIAADARQAPPAPVEAAAPPEQVVEPGEAPPRESGVKPPSRKDPKVIPTATRLNDWYTKTYGTTPSPAVKEAFQKSAERFRLVHIPLDVLTLDPNQEQPAIEQAEEIKSLSNQELADLPPILATMNESGSLQIADGAKRVTGARMNGGTTTIKGYVPESVAQQIEAGTIRPPAAEGVAPPAEGAAPPPGVETGREGAETEQRPEAGRPADEPGAVAERLGIKYEGHQFGKDGIQIVSDQYTDPQTGTTFTVKPGGDVRLALIEARKRFESEKKRVEEEDRPKDPRVRNLQALADTAIAAGDVETMRSIQSRLLKLKRKADSPYGVSSPRAKDTVRKTQEIIDALESRIAEINEKAGLEGKTPPDDVQEEGKPGEQPPGVEQKGTTRVERAEEAFEREYDLARRDPLTGIANLRAANEQMEDLITKADQEKKPVAIGGIDLILFKQVNDVLGHEAGDRALVAAAKAMEDSVRSPSDKREGDVFGIVARLGGDEFEFALYDVTAEQAQMVGERMQAAYVKAMADQGVELPAGLKTLLGFGFTIREPGDSRSIKELRGAADQNLEARKSDLKKREGLPSREEAAARIKAAQEAPKAKPSERKKLTGFRATGAKPEEIYGPEAVAEGRAVPILGPGTYIAFSKDDAGVFAGKSGTVNTAEITLENPLIINTTREWNQILDAAGTLTLSSTSEEAFKFPERRAGDTIKLQKYLIDQGYDGVIVNNTSEHKRLRESFGVDQAVLFKKEPTRAEAPPQEVKPPPEPKVEPEEGPAEGKPEEGEPPQPANELLEQETGIEGAQLWFYPTDDPKIKAAQAKTKAEFIKTVALKAPPGIKKRKTPAPKKFGGPAKDLPGRLRAAAKLTDRTDMDAVLIDEDGKRLSTSDGSSLWVATNETESWGSPGVHSINRIGGLGPDPETRFSKKNVADFDGVISGIDGKKGPLTGTTSIETASNHLRQISILAAPGDQLGAMVVINPDGTLGYAKGGAMGHAEVNVKDGYTELPVGVDPVRLLQTFEFMNAAGVTEVSVFANNAGVKAQPFVFEGTAEGRFVQTAVMPTTYTKGETEAKPKVEPEAEAEPGVEGDIMTAPLAFDAATGQTLVGAKAKPGKQTKGRLKPSPAGTKPLTDPSYTGDLNPLGAKEGAFRRQVIGDKAKKIKSAIARARARRDGGESLELDNIFEIIKDMARRFNVGAPGLARHPILSRWAAAFYRSDSEAIRLRRGSFVSSFVHEAGHHLHKTLFPRASRPSKASLTSKTSGKIGRYDFPAVWRNELVQLGKDLYGDRKPNSGYTAEGWAEVIRFLVTDPAHLKKRAPAVYQGVVSQLVTHHPEIWLVLQDARVRLINAVRIAQTDPVDQFIAHDEGKFRDLLKFSTRNLIDDVRSRLFDRYQRLTTFVSDLGLQDMPAHLNPHTMALRASGHISGDIKLAMQRGTFNPNDPLRQKTGKGLIEILEPVKNNLRLWQNYMVAKRTVEKRAQGYGVLPQDPRLGNQTATPQLKDYIARVEGTHPEFKTASNEFQEFNQWLIGEYAVGYGLISSEQAQLIMDKNLEYITFRHKKTEDALQRKYGARSSRSGFTGQSSGISRFREGFGEQIFPPLESFLASMQGIMSRARLNQVGRSVVQKLDAGVPGAGRWVDRRAQPKEAFKLSAENLSDEIQKQLGIGISDDGQITLPPYLQDLTEEQLSGLIDTFRGLNGATFWRPGNKTDRDNKEVTVMVNGKPQFYEIKDSRLFDLLEGLNNPSTAHTVVKVLGVPGRVLRAGATQFNPSFFIPNFMRDFTQAATMTDTEMRKLPEQARLRIKGMKQAFLGGDIHELFLASGADMSGLFGEYYDPVTQKLDFDKMFERPRLLGLTKGDNVRSMIRDALRLGPIDRLNRAFEMANRMGEFAVAFEQSKAAGKAVGEAAATAGQAAADITLDFQRGGTWSKQVNEVIPFFNATLLGGDKLARFIKKNPPKAAGRILATVLVPSLISMLLNMDEEDYWSKPKGMRDRYWYFPTGHDDSGHPTYLRIPKPYGIGAFAIAFERSFAYAYGINPETGEPGGDPRAWEGGVWAMIREFRPSLSIAGLLPIIEVNAGDQGYSFWRDNEIVSYADKDLPLGEQGATRSSDLARILGRWMDYPPAKIDYLIQGWGGGATKDAVQVGIDPLIRAVDPEAKKGEPLEFRDWLIVRRFLAKHTRGGHESITRFYDDYDSLKRINRGRKAREQEPDRLDAYERKHDAQIALWPEYTGAHRRMSEQFGELRRLYRFSDQFDADELDERVTNIYDEIIGISREAHKIRRQALERKR